VRAELRLPTRFLHSPIGRAALVSTVDAVGGRQPEFLRDLGGADRRADLEKQPMRLPKLSLARSFVTAKPRQMSTLECRNGS